MRNFIEKCGIKTKLALLVVAILLIVSPSFINNSSSNNNNNNTTTISTSTETQNVENEAATNSDRTIDEPKSDTAKPTQEQNIQTQQNNNTSQTNASSFDYASVPAYSGNPVAIINNNVPFFADAEKTTAAFENYSELDSLGRCGVAYANICTEIMPTEKRGKIGEVKPSGWHNAKYAGIDGNYIYNRCHLIGFQLAGENANTKNLITGTRYFNVEGMEPYENQVAQYVKRTNHHVLYRVTPIFVDSELVARGVLMEAQSVEDNSIQFCVFAYNVQPNCTIDYKTGYTTGPEFKGSGK